MIYTWLTTMPMNHITTKNNICDIKEILLGSYCKTVISKSSKKRRISTTQYKKLDGDMSSTQTIIII